MKLALLPFPHIDPVLIKLGPLAIRWYALAYIAGIVLGFMSLKTRSIWLGAAIHMSVALSMDFLSLWRQHRFV